MTDKRWQSALTGDFGLINMPPRWTFQVVESQQLDKVVDDSAPFSLLDEINRTDASVSAAMVKAMEEGHVAITCQNPKAGDAVTRPLSEAQQDRFTVQLRF